MMPDIYNVALLTQKIQTIVSSDYSVMKYQSPKNESKFVCEKVQSGHLMDFIQIHN